MADYSQGVVLEADNPLRYANLSVFVAPAPRPEERLFERRLRDRAGEQQAGLDVSERPASQQVTLKDSGKCRFRSGPAYRWVGSGYTMYIPLVWHVTKKLIRHGNSAALVIDKATAARVRSQMRLRNHAGGSPGKQSRLAPQLRP